MGIQRILRIGEYPAEAIDMNRITAEWISHGNWPTVHSCFGHANADKYREGEWQLYQVFLLSLPLNIQVLSSKIALGQQKGLQPHEQPFTEGCGLVCSIRLGITRSLFFSTSSVLRTSALNLLHNNQKSVITIAEKKRNKRFCDKDPGRQN